MFSSILAIILTSHLLSYTSCDRLKTFDNYYYSQPEDQDEYPTKHQWSLNYGDPEDFRFDVHDVCRDHLGGLWDVITPDQMTFFEFGVSVRDRRYFCGLPEESKAFAQPDHITQAVVVYTGSEREDYSKLFDVSSTFADYEQVATGVRLSPKIYGIFEGGRIEEYIHNGFFAFAEDSPDLTDEIFRKVGHFNRMQPPISKSIEAFWEMVEAMVKKTLKDIEDGKHKVFKKTTELFIQEWASFDFMAELQWLKHMLSPVPIVYNHLSLTETDVFYDPAHMDLTQDCDDQVMILDPGYGMYTYQGYDLATFLNSFEENIIGSSPYPHFEGINSQIEEIKLKFLIAEYIKAYNGLPKEAIVSERDINEFQDMMDGTSLLAQIMSSIQAMHSTFHNFGKKVGFPELAFYRLMQYQAEKNKFLESLVENMNEVAVFQPVIDTEAIAEEVAKESSGSLIHKPTKTSVSSFDHVYINQYMSDPMAQHHLGGQPIHDPFLQAHLENLLMQQTMGIGTPPFIPVEHQILQDQLFQEQLLQDPLIQQQLLEEQLWHEQLIFQQLEEAALFEHQQQQSIAHQMMIQSHPEAALAGKEIHEPVPVLEIVPVLPHISA